MADKQRTIKAPVKVAGVGLHSGREVTMTFIPAPENHGIKFKRVDLDGQPIIKADADLVVDVSRGTTLEHNNARVATVEHSLAAVSSLYIDNLMIELDAEETPIMDGSSKVFVEALADVGTVEQNAERKYFRITENIFYAEPERKVEMVAMPAENFQVTVMIDFDSPVLGSQHASIESLDEFREKVADARTFCFLHELEYLYDNKLIQGGDLNNAIVVVDREVTEKELVRLREMFQNDEVQVRQQGILNNVELRYQNEPARHKLLDVVGDLALVGMPIKGKILASRPGHKANVEFARKIKSLIKKQKHTADVPVYDPTIEPLYDNKAIQKFLPHRYPFLLIDKIIHLENEVVVGVKNVTASEPQFMGHFPGNPVMPGVLQIEAMAQTGGILVMNTVDDPENYETYFLKIDKARFKRKVVPGDTLIIKMELLSPIRRGLCEMKGTAYVGDKLAAEAEMVAQIIKKKPA